MLSAATLTFAAPDLLGRLEACSEDMLDALGFGVIGFDAEGRVGRYNRHESEAAALLPQRVLGQPLFAVVAPCMNNFMIAQRFEDAAQAGQALDVCLAYVLTLRMRPTPVTLRLLAAPGSRWRYVLVQRAS